MTMTLGEIEDMAADYKLALKDKLTGELAVQNIMFRLETLKARIVTQACEDGLIKGKNAEARKYETEVILSNSDAYELLLDTLLSAQLVANQATVEFKAQELLTSLIRAWLYAQRPELP